MQKDHHVHGDVHKYQQTNNHPQQIRISEHRHQRYSKPVRTRIGSGKVLEPVDEGLCVVWVLHESNKLHGRVSAIKCVFADRFNTVFYLCYCFDEPNISAMIRMMNKIVATKSAIFQKLYGLSPWISPVRPLTTIWKTF